MRSIRSRINIPPSKKIDLYVKGKEAQVDLIDQNSNLIMSLAKLESYSAGSSIQKPSQSAAAVVHGMELYIPLEGLVDLDKERLQLNKRNTKIEFLLNYIDKKLSNQNFVTRAPKEIIDNFELSFLIWFAGQQENPISDSFSKSCILYTSPSPRD